MAKKELLSKLNLKDYNNELELIIEKKDFSSQVKNLLLSMFYKIETNYKDYATVKQYTQTKEEFIEKIINIIEKQCDSIELIKPKEDDVKKFYINIKENKIECYQNESTLLHAILELENKEFSISEDYKIIKSAIATLVKDGYELDAKEILTNFDGWSWNNNIDKTDDIESYIVYQNLRLLMGINFLYDWQNEEYKQKDFLMEIQENSKEFFTAFCKVAILKIIENEEEKKYIKEELNVIKNKLEKMKNKSEFLKSIYNEKKDATEKIKLLDKILNDNDLIKAEFLSRNSKLEYENKIFSISDLSELIEKERTEYMQKLQECNSLLEPKKYIENVKKLEERIELIENINFENVTQEQRYTELLRLQKSFIKIIKNKAERATTKKEILQFIYLYRYYIYLPVRKNEETLLVKEIKEIKKELEELSKTIITKACKLKALIIINQDIKYNHKMMQMILDTKIIKLEDIYIALSKKEESIIIDIYDGEIIDTTKEILKDKEEDFMLKFNKKNKLFYVGGVI